MSNNNDRRNWHDEDGADQPTPAPYYSTANVASMKSEAPITARCQYYAKTSDTMSEEDTEVQYNDNMDMEEEEKRVRTVVRTTKYINYTDTKETDSARNNETSQQEDDDEEPSQGEAPCGVLWVHLVRAFKWRLAGLGPMPKEAKVLDKNNISNDTLRAYLVWRRSVLLVALPAIFFSAVLAWINLGMTYPDNKQALNGFGDFIYFIPSAASTILFIVMIVVVIRWTHWRQTALLFKIGWSISFILPFLPAIFPISFLLHSCETLWGDCSDPTVSSDFAARVAVLELSLAVQYAFQLFPILITFPGGLSRASLKIRGLLPESTLSSWILVISAPFQSVIFLMALVLLIQLSGNIPLFSGTILLFCAPWIYVIRRKVYVGIPTEEREKQLDRTQLVIGLFVSLGGVFFLIWAFTGDLFGVRLLGTPNEDSVMSYWALLRVIFEAFGRNLATTVLFTDVLLRMAVTNWRQDQDRRRGENGKMIDDMFGAIEHSISSDASKEARSGSNETPELDDLDV